MQDDELELIRRRKMAELQSAQQAQLQQQAMMQEQAARREAEIQAIMRQILTPEARDRLATVRLAYPEVAAAVEEQLIRLLQMGRVQGQIDDHTLKTILHRFTPQRRDIKIERV
ncbi:MAG TPA: DNA-binding protein [Methanomassiliicoccaceae archaeon]|jgi:programmed cell death protein 5|nr:DNA-binding protein [Euryarchaeota archaeon]HOB37499.1 DNA-binding protein [Methanomassiliicoccaceae archaeon]HOK28275.1 DNA-binding protein [Methanomassiliicoccaceae archaeon]HOL07720.1 DNA-binding protein [Methanomassiliicoccaceae archaeon]HOQ26466.1 DNA-binding protein [Methanomassiliicoccaceae archaeon]